MLKLYLLEPEVAGGWGARTTVSNQRDVERSGAVPLVTTLEYEFQGWLGDELLESFPCFIVTVALADSLRKAKLKGAAFSDVIISKSELFTEMHPKRKLPPFERLLPQGKVRYDKMLGAATDWSGDSVCATQRGQLVVDEAFLLILRRHKSANCEIIKI